MPYGTGDFTYEFVEEWGKLPEGYEYRHVNGVATDAQDRVHVAHNGEHPMCVFDRDGYFLYSWGDGFLKDPHAVFITEDGHQYIVDRSSHAVHRFNKDNELELTLGTIDVPGSPFNRVAGISLDGDGTIFISDGYVNSVIQKYSADGKLLQTFGTPGSEPGQFNIPHAVWAMKDGRLAVSDRENNRVQFFSPDGEFLEEWAGLLQPTFVFQDTEGILYVAELGGRVTMRTPEGEVLAGWGEGKTMEPGQFWAPHHEWVDSRGDLYVAEVQDGRRLQKFRRTPASHND